MILLAIAIAAFNQLSGINAILYYAPEVMKSAGASGDAALWMSVGVGLMNLIATMAALSVIDKIGRRKLMIVGSIGYLISLTFLAAVLFAYAGNYNTTSAVLVLAGLLAFIAAHAFGQGSVIWVFISEIFPNRIRGRGQSLGSLTHWVFAALTSFAFPPIVGALGGGVGFSIFFDLHGRPAHLGAQGDARDQGCPAGGDEWFYPDRAIDDVVQDWLALGPSLVVVTRGGEGATFAVRGADPARAASADVQMVDTVGAGDSFMAGLLSGLLDAGLLGGEGARVKLGRATPGDVLPAVQRAIATSGVTVSRAGAYAPTRKELETVL